MTYQAETSVLPEDLINLLFVVSHANRPANFPTVFMVDAFAAMFAAVSLGVSSIEYVTFVSAILIPYTV
jgi:hypothetical protein